MVDKMFNYEEHKKRMRARLQPPKETIGGRGTLDSLLKRLKAKSPIKEIK